MLGFIIGTVCLIGLIKVVRGPRHGWARMHGGCGGGGYGWGGPRFGGFGHRHGHGGFGGHGDGWGYGGGGGDEARGPFGGFFLRGLFQRLDTTPGQEKVIRSAFEQVQKTMREARGEWRDGHEIADLFRAESFDRTAAEGISGKADASFAKVRVALLEALAQIHEVLDDRQRGMIAEFLAQRGIFSGGRGARSAWV